MIPGTSRDKPASYEMIRSGRPALWEPWTTVVLVLSGDEWKGGRGPFIKSSLEDLFGGR